MPIFVGPPRVGWPKCAEEAIRKRTPYKMAEVRGRGFVGPPLVGWPKCAEEAIRKRTPYKMAEVRGRGDPQADALQDCVGVWRIAGVQ